MRKIALIFLLMSSFSFASTKSQQRLWYGMFGKKEITSTNHLFHEVQLRYDLNTPTMQQTLFRFGLLHQINSKHEIGILGGHIQTGNTKEYRPTFQYSYSLNSNFSLRNRLEGRFLEDQSETSLRYRLLLRAIKPLSSSIDLVSWDEPFMNLTQEDWSGDRFLERNRFFLGSRFLFEKISIEAGYLNQYIPRSNQSVIEHTLVLYLFY